MNFFGFLVGSLFYGGVAVAIVFIVKHQKEKRRQQALELAKEKERQEAYKREMIEEKRKDLSANGAPIVAAVTLQLAQGEFCHFVGEAYFCEMKQQVVGYEGGSGGTSVAVVKGVRVNVGSHKGHYVREEIMEKTDGTIYLTSKKIIFTAIKNSSSIRYDDIINVNVIGEMLQIQTDKKSYLFQVVDFVTFVPMLEYVINNRQNLATTKTCDVAKKTV